MSEELQTKDDGKSMQYPMFGVTSFAELDEVQGVYMAAEAVEQLAEHFCMITSNIVLDESIADKTAALRALAKEFASRVNAAVNKTKERQGFLNVVRRLLKRQPEQKQADTQPVEAESEQPTEVAIPIDGPIVEDAPPVDTSKSFSLWKTKEGSYRWLAVYSNQFRDSDYPPEILSEKAHKAFVAMVDAGLVDYPELWHWHIPGTAWGKADWVAYDNGFALASGYVYPGHEKEADLVSRMEDIRVSHGMPSRHIVRNKDDASIIDMYVSVEISPLPGWAAANKLTDFVMLKEFIEMLSPEKRDYLSKAGLDEATISQIESQLSEKAKAAKDAGIEAKEQDKETPVTEQQPAATADYATKEEVAGVFANTLKPLTEAITTLQTTLLNLQAEVKSLKQADEEKIVAKAAATPQASLAELIAAQFSANNALDGRTTLAKSGPKQTQPEKANYTGVPFLDGIIERSQQGVSQ